MKRIGELELDESILNLLFLSFKRVGNSDRGKMQKGKRTMSLSKILTPINVTSLIAKQPLQQSITFSRRNSEKN